MEKDRVNIFKTTLTYVVLSFLIVASFPSTGFAVEKEITFKSQSDNIIPLPQPRLDGEVSVESTLKQRRSTREFSAAPLGIEDVSQLLWAAQGVTNPEGFRTAPSAGALYPLEVYVVAGVVRELAAGVYKYQPFRHQLKQISRKDKRSELAEAALGQESVKNNAVVLVFSAVEKRTTAKYGSRGIRYIHIEVGHAAQNVYLQAMSLGLGTVAVGAFDDDAVKRVLEMPAEEMALYLMPLGKP
jgi:SagB-type dehydrogenase family enzyme